MQRAKGAEMQFFHEKQLIFDENRLFRRLLQYADV